MKHYSVAIVGAGMVGATLAVGLARHVSALKIALIDPLPASLKTEKNFDGRSVVLSYGSKKIFQGLGLWQELAQTTLGITHIHVSNQHHLGLTRFSSKQQKLPALGYVVEVEDLNRVLTEELPKWQQIDCFIPNKVIAFHDKKLTLDNGEIISADLIIAADGTHSVMASLLNATPEKCDYFHDALVANIALKRPHQNVAYERFTTHGPIALLPLTQNRAALVWSYPREKIAELMNLSDEEFLIKLQQQFGYRLGRFTQVGRRFSFPLVRHYLAKQVYGNVVFVGNAAHTLHPIAAQGYNLGLRDVAWLIETIQQSLMAGKSIDDPEQLNRYQNNRSRDQKQLLMLTDSLARLFTHEFLPLNFVTNASMVAMDLISPLKNYFATTALGLSGRLPKLAQGVELEIL